MPQFTIECSYRLPVFRHRTYEAATPEDACRLALEDEDWTGQKEDYESCGATFLTGIWPGIDTAYAAPALTLPPGFGEDDHPRGDAEGPDQQPDPDLVAPAVAALMPRCRHCGSADILRDANACWDEVAQAWSLLATYDSHTCERCGADSNNLALWFPATAPGSDAAFLWEVIQILENMSLATDAAFQRFCAERHRSVSAADAAAAWRSAAAA